MTSPKQRHPKEVVYPQYRVYFCNLKSSYQQSAVSKNLLDCGFKHAAMTDGSLSLHGVEQRTMPR